MNDQKKSQRVRRGRESATKAIAGPSEVNEWLTESLRFTAFSVDSKEVGIASFEALTKSPAEQITERPKGDVAKEIAKRYCAILGSK
jgi:hypothetical protein